MKEAQSATSWPSETRYDLEAIVAQEEYSTLCSANGTIPREVWGSQSRGRLRVQPHHHRLCVNPDGEAAPIDRGLMAFMLMANAITEGGACLGHALS